MTNLDEARRIIDSYSADLLALVPDDRQEKVGGMLQDLRGTLLLAVARGDLHDLEQEFADSVTWCRIVAFEDAQSQGTHKGCKSDHGQPDQSW